MLFFFFFRILAWLTSFCIGILLFILIGGLSFQASAEIQIPFDRTDSGLDVIPSGEDIIVENAPDAGANQIVNILLTIYDTLKWVLGFLVFGWIVYAGVYLVSSAGSEDSYSKSVKMVSYAISGLVLMLLSDVFILDILYGGGSSGIQSDDSLSEKFLAGTSNFRIQVEGVLSFIKTLLVFIAMAYVIVSGVRIIASFGDEEGLRSAKNIFTPLIFGILVILFNEVFIDYVLYNIDFDGEKVIFEPNATEAGEAIKQIIGFINYILQFIAIIVLGFLIYGGFLYIASFGESERAEQGRKILINAFIALVIIIFSYILMWSLVNFSFSSIA